MAIEVKLEQLSKALLPILVTLFGIVNEPVKLVDLPKARIPIVVHDVPISKRVALYGVLLSFQISGISPSKETNKLSPLSYNDVEKGPVKADVLLPANGNGKFNDILPYI